MAHGERRRSGRLRSLGSGRRQDIAPGPFSGIDIERVLKARDYRLEAEPAEDELPIYVHPETGDKVPVNPDWTVHAGDPIFETVRLDMRVSRRTLQRELGLH